MIKKKKYILNRRRKTKKSFLSLFEKRKNTKIFGCNLNMSPTFDDNILFNEDKKIKQIIYHNLAK